MIARFRRLTVPLGGATVTIGYASGIDGSPKLGSVQLLGPNSNVIPASASIIMLSGSQTNVTSGPPSRQNLSR